MKFPSLRVRPACLVCIASLCFSTYVSAANTHLPASNNSGTSAFVSLMVVVGSMAMFEGAGKVVVESVKAVGNGAQVVLKSGGEVSADASRVTLQLSGGAAEGLSAVVGSSCELLATATGHVLVASGKVLAFIPNEIGHSLLHHSAAGGR